jgi:hypothetical protein
VILTTKNCVLRSLRFLGLEKPVVPIIKRLVGLARGRTFTQFLFLFTKKIIIRGLRVIKMEKPIKKAVDNSKYWFHRHDKMGKLWMQRLGFRKFVPGENQLPMGELPPHVL